MIRVARPDDAAAIRRVAESAYHVYVKDLGRPPAPMVADFGAHIDQDRVIVSEQDRRVCGYAILVADDRRALLDNIAVDPAYQGRGIGRALIDDVERHAASIGHRDLELYTNVVMADNVRWYLAQGFVETKRVTEGGFRRIYMTKPVKAAR